MSKRRRAQLIRWAVYALTLLGVGALALWIDWAHVQDAMLRPDLAKEQFPDILTKAAKNTVIFTVFGFSGGLVLGLVIALMRLSSIRAYRWFAVGYIELFRGVPALLTILIIGFGIPIALGSRIPGTYGPGAVALAIVAAAYMAETIRAGIEAVPKGQMEAARSLGMSHSRAMASIVIPQAFRLMIPPLTNELVLLVKDTSLLSVLGVTEATIELTRWGRNATNHSANATPLVVAGFVYLLLTIPLGRLAAMLERRGKQTR
ncbi:MAG TPA: amino acid ABC transporter permease [Acidimicrobiales bacterium]|jgi:polar amino acid transport system permease protein